MASDSPSEDEPIASDAPDPVVASAPLHAVSGDTAAATDLGLCVAALLTPRSVFVSIDDVVTVRPEYVERVVTSTVDLSKAYCPSPVLLPVLIAALDDIDEDVSVTVDGVQITLLDGEAALQKEAEVVDLIVRAENPSSADTFNPDVAATLIANLRSVMSARQSRDKVPDPKMLAAQLTGLGPSAMAVLSLLGSAYLRMAAIPYDGAHRQVSVIVSGQVSSRWRKRGLINVLRSGFGLRPFVYRCEAPGLDATPRYRCRIVGPDDHFVRYEGWVSETTRTRKKVVDDYWEEDGRRVTKTTPTLIQESSVSELKHVSVGGTRPGSIADLSGADSARVETPVHALAVFNERPPGSLAQALLFTLVAACLIGLAVLLFHPLVGSAGINAEMALVLFTIPVTAALLARPDRKIKGRRDHPMVTHVALISAAVASFVSGSIFLAADSRAESICPSLAVDCELAVDEPNFGWVDPPLVKIGVGSDRHLVAGWRAILLAVAGSLLAVVLYLSLRWAYSVRNFSRAQHGRQPSPLPDRLGRSMDIAVATSRGNSDNIEPMTPPSKPQLPSSSSLLRRLWPGRKATSSSQQQVSPLGELVPSVRSPATIRNVEFGSAHRYGELYVAAFDVYRPLLEEAQGRAVVDGIRIPPEDR